jgi:hypothetical protein
MAQYARSKVRPAKQLVATEGQSTAAKQLVATEGQPTAAKQLYLNNYTTGSRSESWNASIKGILAICQIEEAL